jgi:hypothetical protein
MRRGPLRQQKRQRRDLLVQRRIQVKLQVFECQTFGLYAKRASAGNIKENNNQWHILLESSFLSFLDNCISPKKIPCERPRL